MKSVKKLDQGNFQVARMGWLADYNDPMTFLQQFKDKNDLNNDTGWENKQYQELLTLASREANPDKRKQLLQQAEQILMDEMPVIPLYFYSGNYVKNVRVQNVILDPLGNVDTILIPRKRYMHVLLHTIFSNFFNRIASYGNRITN
ncbi:hypothetical protein [Brevibacillus sp. SYSU BS000544]|uniref:hypothetical protein n=1 Tax=Brevibacillus sp. SYSU BS000544 TaxID=3416443 RepID=UPI003CE46D0D